MCVAGSVPMGDCGHWRTVRPDLGSDLVRIAVAWQHLDRKRHKKLIDVQNLQLKPTGQPNNGERVLCRLAAGRFMCTSITQVTQ